MSEAAVRIRDETAGDVDAIASVTLAAFRDHPHSRQTEAFIIRDLRAAGALALSLVAEEEDGRVVGHAGFSPVVMSDGTAGWYGVGPVSVGPDRQRRGIGSALMTAGIARLKSMGAKGCVLVGDPAFYTRLGFRNAPALTLEGVPPEVFLALPFDAAIPTGRVTFHPAFAATA